MNIDYCEKYLKYKKKYINLKYYGGMKADAPVFKTNDQKTAEARARAAAEARARAAAAERAKAEIAAAAEAAAEAAAVAAAVAAEEFEAFIGAAAPAPAPAPAPAAVSAAASAAASAKTPAAVSAAASAKTPAAVSAAAPAAAVSAASAKTLLTIYSINAGLPRSKTILNKKQIIQEIITRDGHVDSSNIIILAQEVNNHDKGPPLPDYIQIVENNQYRQDPNGPNYLKMEDSINFIAYNRNFYPVSRFIDFESRHELSNLIKNLTESEINYLYYRSSGLLLLKDKDGNRYLVISVHAKEIKQDCLNYGNKHIGLDKFNSQMKFMKHFYSCINKLISYANKNQINIIFGGDYNSNLNNIIDDIINVCNENISNLIEQKINENVDINNKFNREVTAFYRYLSNPYEFSFDLSAIKQPRIEYLLEGYYNYINPEPL